MDYTKLSPKVYSQMFDRAQDIGSSQKIDSFNAQELTEALDLLVFEYSKSIEAGWHLVAPDIDDVMYTASERDMIHNIATYLRDNQIDFDAARLTSLDKKWQDQILSYIAADEVNQPFYPNSDEALSKWWLHIEELDKLSAEDRSTL